MAGVYTTKSIVANFLGISETELTNKVPDIESRISRVEDYIDRRLQTTYKSKQVSNEYHTPTRTYGIDGWVIFTKHRPIISVDKLEIFKGNSWEDWVQTRTEGRNKDYWVNYERGEIFLMMPLFPMIFIPDREQVRVTYTYGRGATETNRSAIPKDLEDVATKLVVIDILTSESYKAILPSGDNILSNREKIEEWKQYCENWLRMNAEIIPIDNWR